MNQIPDVFICVICNDILADCEKMKHISRRGYDKIGYCTGCEYTIYRCYLCDINIYSKNNDGIIRHFIKHSGENYRKLATVENVVYSFEHKLPKYTLFLDWGSETGNKISEMLTNSIEDCDRNMNKYNYKCTMCELYFECLPDKILLSRHIMKHHSLYVNSEDFLSSAKNIVSHGNTSDNISICYSNSSDEDISNGIVNYMLKSKKKCLELNLVEIKDNRVYAKLDINIGELITYYPAHFASSDGKTFSHSQEIINSDNFHYPEDYPECIFRYGKKYAIAGSPFIWNPTNAGHIIRDGAKFDGFEEKYEVDSETMQNAKCLVNNDIKKPVEIIATKHIKKDEEIFIKYGIPKWMEILRNQ